MEFSPIHFHHNNLSMHYGRIASRLLFFSVSVFPSRQGWTPRVEPDCWIIGDFYSVCSVFCDLRTWCIGRLHFSIPPCSWDCTLAMLISLTDLHDQATRINQPRGSKSVECALRVQVRSSMRACWHWLDLSDSTGRPPAEVSGAEHLFVGVRSDSPWMRDEGI